MKPYSKELLKTHDLIAYGKEVIEIELAAIANLQTRIDQNFHKACAITLKTTGHIIVIGMGKSGHIGNKISATLASTGTPAFFVHPSEANHGDLGMITKNDVILAISNSGSTEEVLNLLPRLKRLGTPIISMTGNKLSPLAQAADVNLDISVTLEACPLGLAPTSSTTTTLVMGDAFAIALLRAKGFTEEDFALSHPGGALGRKLLIRAKDIMHTENQIAKVKSEALVSEALLEISAKGLGITAVVNDNDIIIGLYTDGDLRRTLEKKIDIHNTNITEVMTRNFTTVKAETLAAQALKIMEDKRINALPVVNENKKLIGIFNMHDLLKAKIA